ncbi:AraC family transcriptional regulator [Cohnella yongneupensis]|uniref:Helix-turn-helix domain-containing protein n=1 Tax=Cohnella yongneupensis TaxID=425006 RepID=A0ABW0R2W0_9BACL
MDNELDNAKKKDRKPASSASPFPYARMDKKPYALDRLDLQFRWGGYRIRVLRCHLVHFSPGHIVNFHKHSEFEFHFIPKGKGKVIIRDQTYDLHEGLFYLTGPDVVHYQESDPDDPMDELCLHCDFALIDDNPETGLNWGDALEVEEAKECIAAIRAMPGMPMADRFNAMNGFLEAYRAWEEQPLGYYTQIKQAIVQILLRSVRVFDNRSVQRGIPERDMNFHRYQMATQYIRDNESMPISLEQVADRINVSPRQLQRIFRSEGQTTFRDYLEHVRLTLICSELIQTDKAIEEIAVEHGYANPNYLYPVFKNKFEVTPSVYRRMHAASAETERERERAHE